MYRLSQLPVHPIIHLFVHSLNRWIWMSHYSRLWGHNSKQDTSCLSLTQAGEGADTPVNKFTKDWVLDWNRSYKSNQNMKEVCGIGIRYIFLPPKKEPNNTKNRTNISQTDFGLNMGLFTMWDRLASWLQFNKLNGRSSGLSCREPSFLLVSGIRRGTLLISHLLFPKLVMG